MLSNAYTLPQTHFHSNSRQHIKKKDFRTRLRRKIKFPKATQGSGRANAKFSVLLLRSPQILISRNYCFCLQHHTKRLKPVESLHSWSMKRVSWRRWWNSRYSGEIISQMNLDTEVKSIATHRGGGSEWKGEPQKGNKPSEVPGNLPPWHKLYKGKSSGQTCQEG